MLRLRAVCLILRVFPAFTAFVTRHSTCLTLRTLIPRPRPANILAKVRGLHFEAIFLSLYFLLPAMSRNAARFSAFSTIVMVRACAAGLLFAAASFYFIALWVIVSVSTLLVVTGIRRIAGRRDAKKWQRHCMPERGMRTGNPSQNSDYYPRQICRSNTGAQASRPSQQSALVLVNGLLPGLPPICLN